MFAVASDRLLDGADRISSGKQNREGNTPIRRPEDLDDTASGVESKHDQYQGDYPGNSSTYDHVDL